MRTIVALVCFVFVCNLLLVPIHYARAQLVVTDPVTGQAVTIKNVKDFIKTLLVGVAGVAVINAANYFAQKLAYDAAVALVSGGKGQMPLFSTKGWGDYFKDASLGAVGEFVGTLSEGFEGLDLCNPGPPGLVAKLQTSLVKPYIPVGEGPEPKCEWSNISENWTEFTEDFTTGEVLQRSGVMFEPGQSPLSITLEASRNLSVQVYEMEKLKTLEREEGEGFLAKTGIISGEVQTPAQVIAQKAKDLSKSGEESQQTNVQMMGSALGAGATQILTSALGTFVNTLAGKLLEKIFNKGLISFQKKGKNTGALINPEFSLVGTREVAQEMQSDLITPPIKEAEVFDQVTDFSVCPSQFASPNNCVIDQGFSEALRREQSGTPLSVKEAINQGLLRGDWPLISSYDRARNTDIFCYTYGYCYSNLVKLRKARIVPIGWEIAAQKSGASASQITLSQAMDAFYDCGTDADGRPVVDSEHPWCHLVDPNWIIKYPLTQCRASVYGSTLLTAENSLRSETCVDSPTCIAVDDGGSCVGGWGYCTREKNTWHFDGDQCPARYESCIALEDRSGNQVSYLLNTVNYGACTSENVGCRWYAREKAGDNWTATASYNSTDKTMVATAGAIYLNKNAAECSASDAGCTEMIRATATGATLNILPNPSFETASAENPAMPENWVAARDNSKYTSAATTLDATGDKSYDGVAAVSPGTGLAAEVKLNASRFYTFSFYARTSSRATLLAGVSVLKSDRVKADLTPYYFSGTNCTRGTQFGEGGVNESVYFNQIAPPTEYARYSCTFTTPVAAASPKGYFIGQIFLYSQDGTWIDAVQLEESETVTAFHEGISSGAGSVYLKKPPEYLGCTGASTDPAECSNYLRQCLASDVGCSMYYPTNGDPALAAVATGENICPAECVGYDTFREEPSQWTAAAKFPLYLIPDTAEMCEASVVGCDEFTNLDAAEAGGESKNYFTSIRSCQKPAADSETFYTWEGSDTAGYQLKTWVLKASDKDAGPCTTLAPGGTCNDPAVGTADYDERDCSEDFKTDANCREFYNTAGGIFYRNYSDTIISTDECYRYRKTEATGEADCESTGGQWSAAGECIYLGYPSESQRCGAESAGCRAYTGPTSRNVEEEFFDEFENNTTQDWQGGAVSTESVTLGGHSLKAASGAAVSKTWELTAGETYILSFWAKGQGTVAAQIDGEPLGSVALGSEWANYQVGPLLMSEAGIGSVVSFSGFAVDSYLDNIRLTRVSDHLYLIRNSWYTPMVCDMNNQGVYLPRAQLGCRAYTDSENQEKYFKSFDRLCSEGAVGCEAFIDTYNSASTAKQIFNQGEDGAEVTVPGDTLSYYVYDENMACGADAKGCEAMGRPILDQDGHTVLSYDDVYLVNDPENYSNSLCLTEEAYCDEFKGDTGTYYFKHPEDKTCEFKEKVKIAGLEYSGWFRTGTEDPCYGSYLGAGNSYGIWKNGDSGYDAWYGNCPADMSTCTKFTDPADTSADEPQGKSYYYLDNDTLDTKSCAGSASKSAGCALFNSTSKSTKTENSWATYLTSEDNNFAAVATIDCLKSDSPYCTKVCFDKEFGPEAFVPYRFGHNCRDAGDCSGYRGCGEISSFGSKWRHWIPEQNIYQYTGSCEAGSVCAAGNPGCTVGDLCVDMAKELLRNDSNELLKVRRDRECGEWLACRSSVSVWDNETQKYKKICTSLGLCDEFAPVGDSSECVHFIESEHAEDVLSEALYTARDVSWEGQDYSGYAIPNYYSIDELSPIDLSSIVAGSSLPDLRVAYVETGCGAGVATGQTCGDANALGNKGVCVAQKCVYAINGEALPTAGTSAELYTSLTAGENKYRVVGQSCRAYPEEGAPFPSSVAEWENGKMTTIDPNFKRANICEQSIWEDLNSDGVRDENEITYQDCECDYQKVEFGNGAVTKFYSTNEVNIPKGICLNGPRSGLSCVPGAEYDDTLPADSADNQKTCGAITSGGACQAVERADKFVGWLGQCLERDLRTPLNGSTEDFACLTWYPSYILSGGQDVYNLFPNAGYNPTNTGRYWCAEARGIRNSIGPTRAGEDYEVITRDNIASTTKWTKDPPGVLFPGVLCTGAINCPDATGQEKSVCHDFGSYSACATGKFYGSYTASEDSAWNLLVYTADTKDYSERFLPATQYENYYLDEIVAIELAVDGAHNPKLWPDGQNSDTEDFYEDGNNILSRQNEVELKNGFKAWETSWGIPEETKIPSSAPPILTQANYAFSGEYKYEHVTEDASCENDYSDSKSYFAIRAIFDANGKFRGFWTTTCNGTSKPRAWVKFKVVFHLAENCESVAQVVKASGENKAYTDRLYQATNFLMIVGSEYKYPQTFAPFGSAQSYESPLGQKLPWIVGDNRKDKNSVGTPDLSLIPEDYTLAGSSLGCKGACAKEELDDLNFNTLTRALGNLQQLFTAVYKIFEWEPGYKQGKCEPSGGWSEGTGFYIPCNGEGNTCDNDPPGSCVQSLECDIGPLAGDRNCAINDYCQGESGYCYPNPDTTVYGDTGGGRYGVIEEGEGICTGSLRGSALCGDIEYPDEGTNNFPSPEGTINLTVDAERAGDEFCQTSGVCIDWHISDGQTIYQCYGGLKHGESCSGQSDCGINAMNGFCDSGVCTGGGFDSISEKVFCSDNSQCIISNAMCATNVYRCSDGLLSGAECDPGSSICGQSFSCTVDAVPAERDFYEKSVPASVSDTAESQGVPPTVAAIDFTKCDQSTGTCRIAKLNGFDVNNWYYGTITGQEQLKATIRFYAWADHNQMPIVSRTVDWGDSSPKDMTSASKYKNYKPYCDSDSLECSDAPGMTCKTSSDCPSGTGTCQPDLSGVPHFGNDDKACSEGFFQFEHTYLCDGGDELGTCPFSGSPASSDSIPANGCKTATACYYRPRVQVQDNWGWCNGDCNGLGEGCYEDECFITRDDPHWTEFDGYIKINK